MPAEAETEGKSTPLVLKAVARPRSGSQHARRRGLQQRAALIRAVVWTRRCVHDSKGIRPGSDKGLLARGTALARRMATGMLPAN